MWSLMVPPRFMRIVLSVAFVAAILAGHAQAAVRPDTPDDRFAAIVAEYNDAASAYREARQAAEEAGKEPDRTLLPPDDIGCARRLLALAQEAPGTQAAHDALMWVLHRDLGRASGVEPWGPLIDRAVDIIVESYPDDLTIARAALMLYTMHTPSRDRLLQALHDKSRDRQVRGTATMALAQYLMHKAMFVPQLRTREARMPYWTEEYEASYRAIDHQAMLAESERLFAEVIADYGDIPYIRAISEARIKRDTERGLTLADAARNCLDEIHHVSPGSPAPNIVGTDFDGNPLELEPYRGKVVLLIFWGTWCGPCMAQVPHERDLARKYEGKPFAILGVDCDEDKDFARRVMKREGITWPNWNDGMPGEGPIVQRYHVQGYPTTFLIDAKGIIRKRGGIPEYLGPLIDELLAEIPAKP
ncbi:MAG: TlpA disulfide reductase family protein [Isosphaeraceae bacterium]